MIKRVLSLLSVAALLAAPSTTHAQRLGVDFGSIGGGITASGFTYGFAFTALRNSTVTDLAFYDEGKNGLASDHNIGLWTASGTLLASASVSAGTSDPLLSWFRTSAIDPVSLLLGESYVVGATVFGLDPVGFDSPVAPVIDPAIQYVESRFVSSGGALVMPGSTFRPFAYFGGNIVLADSEVPEPSAIVLLMIGLMGLVVVRHRRTKLNLDA